MVSVTMWQIGMFVLGVLSAAGALLGIMAALVDRWLNVRFSGISEQITNMQQAYRDDASALQRVERDLLTLRAELPERYVRREDHIRSQTVIEAKLDTLAARMDRGREVGI